MVLINLPDILCGSNYFSWQNRLAAQTSSLLLNRVQQKTLLLSSEKLSSLCQSPSFHSNTISPQTQICYCNTSISDSLTVQKSLQVESSLILFKMTVSSKNWTEQAGNTFTALHQLKIQHKRVYVYLHPEPDSHAVKISVK